MLKITAYCRHGYDEQAGMCVDCATRPTREIARDIYCLIAKSKRRALEALLKELARSLVSDEEPQEDYEPECVKCINCERCCGVCDCTGGPQTDSKYREDVPR